MELWGDMSIVRLSESGRNEWMDATKVHKSEKMDVSRGVCRSISR